MNLTGESGPGTSNPIATDRAGIALLVRGPLLVVVELGSDRSSGRAGPTNPPRRLARELMFDERADFGAYSLKLSVDCITSIADLSDSANSQVS